MNTISTRARITPVGKLRLEVQTGLPPGAAEVVIVVQASPARPEQAASLSGMFAGREPVEEDVMTYLRQIRRESTEASWKIAD